MLVLARITVEVIYIVSGSGVVCLPSHSRHPSLYKFMITIE